MKPAGRTIKDVRLADLVIDKAQVRTSHVGAEIDELAESIRVMGLLEPIVVCPAEQRGKYEILTGQRRYLAHKKLQRDTISAVVLDRRVDDSEAKAISIAENIMRRDLTPKELINGCTALFNKYGSIKAVVEETGLPYSKVSQYVKYVQLTPKLKKLVDAGTVNIKTALRAQAAAAPDGDVNEDEAILLAKEMGGMSGEQQKRVLKSREENPEAGVEEVIEAAKSSAKVTQVIVTLSGSLHKSLQQFASDESVTQDEAAATLIEEGLKDKGFEV